MKHLAKGKGKDKSLELKKVSDTEAEKLKDKGWRYISKSEYQALQSKGSPRVKVSDKLEAQD